MTRAERVQVVDNGEEMGTMPVPPPDLHRDLGRVLLQDSVGADVTFLVKGQAFRAHRCVLAARSPVLRAELYTPPMKESTNDVIEIDEIEPEAFAALLHFIYNDSLPPESSVADDEVAMAQHLVVAADRYAMERLSLMCQAELGRRVDVAAAADTYALAHQHGLPGLQAAVVEFVARREGRLEEVVASEGFRRLAEVDPAAARDVVSKATAARRRRKLTREVPASCVRFSRKVCCSFLTYLGVIWAWCLRSMARVWAYTRDNFPFVIRVVAVILVTLVKVLAEHPEFVVNLMKLKNLTEKKKKKLKEKLVK